MKIVKVVNVANEALPSATKHVVCVIDESAFLARQVQAERKKELEALEAKKIQLNRFEQLALNYPEAKPLVDELKAFDL